MNSLVGLPLSSGGPFDLRQIQFSRRNCFLCILEDDQDRNLYISLSRSADMWLQRKNLIRLCPTRHGERVPFTYTVGVGQMQIDAAEGRVCVALDANGQMQLESHGLDLELTYTAAEGECTISLPEQRYEAAFHVIGKLAFVPFGAELTAHEESGSRLRLTLHTNAEGSAGLTVSQTLSDFPNPIRYMPPALCSADAEADFELYQRRFPALKPPYASLRTLAAWVIWSHTMGPAGALLHPVVYMTRTQWLRAFGWQQSFQSMAACADACASWDLIQTIFDYQDEAGQLPDSVGDIGSAYMVTKPALQGLALDYWLRHHSLAEIGQDERIKLYRRFSAFADWWLTNRDRNHSGLPQYHHSDESPGEFCACFAEGVPMHSGDLLAFLILLTEGCAKLAASLALDVEAELWMEKSHFLLRVLQTDFWNGSEFRFRTVADGRTVDSRSFMCLLPVILGHRLDPSILDHLCALLADENAYLLPGGVSVEMIGEAQELAQTPGPKGAMAYIGTLVCIGLADAGKWQLLREIAQRTCQSMLRDGFTFMSFPATDGIDKGKIRDRWSSWSAACYLILARLLAEADGAQRQPGADETNQKERVKGE